MKPSEALSAHRDDIRRVVLQHRALNARVFGSVLRGVDSDDSDLDLLVDPTSETTLDGHRGNPGGARKLVRGVCRCLNAQCLAGQVPESGACRGRTGMNQESIRVPDYLVLQCCNARLGPGFYDPGF